MEIAPNDAWHILFVALAWVTLSWWHGSRNRGWRGIGSAFLVFLALSVSATLLSAGRIPWMQLVWSSLAAFVGGLSGVLLSLLVGLATRGLPGPVSAALAHSESAFEKVAERRSFGNGRDLEDAGYGLLRAIAEVRSSLSLTSQGSANSAWTRLQSLHVMFSSLTVDYLRELDKREEEIESSAGLALSRHRTERAESLASFVSDNLNGLASHLVHYQQLTSIWIAVGALLVSLAALVFTPKAGV